MAVSEAQVWSLLETWRREIDSVPMPELVTLEAALAVVAESRRNGQGEVPVARVTNRAVVCG